MTTISRRGFWRLEFYNGEHVTQHGPPDRLGPFPTKRVARAVACDLACEDAEPWDATGGCQNGDGSQDVEGWPVTGEDGSGGWMVQYING